jgi:2-alkenal reductase
MGSCVAGLAGVVYLLNNEPSMQQSARPSTTLMVANRPTQLPSVIVATPEAGIDYETAVLMNIYQQVNPAVVNISIFQQPGSFHSAPLTGVDETDLLEVSGGSGFVWDADGHIVTNYHVVEEAEEVHVKFSDGTMSLAEVVGKDADSDLAVIKIDPSGYDLHPVQRGNIDDVRVGMRVAAIGNPFGFEGTLTSGIVSAIGRSIPSLNRFSIPDSIQTDAPINPGNSGGPLINEQGAVIGVNAQIRSEDRANSGVGFAIPIAIVERVVPALIEKKRYEHSYMGISAITFSPICAQEQQLNPNLRGAWVQEVIRGGPAARAGIQSGESFNTRYPLICPDTSGSDLITAINGQSVRSFDDILIFLARYTSPGDTITLTVLRNGEQLDIPLQLRARPTSS